MSKTYNNFIFILEKEAYLSLPPSKGYNKEKKIPTYSIKVTKNIVNGFKFNNKQSKSIIKSLKENGYTGININPFIEKTVHCLEFASNENIHFKYQSYKCKFSLKDLDDIELNSNHYSHVGHQFFFTTEDKLNYFLLRRIEFFNEYYKNQIDINYKTTMEGLTKKEEFIPILRDYNIENLLE